MCGGGCNASHVLGCAGYRVDYSRRNDLWNFGVGEHNDINFV